MTDVHIPADGISPEGWVEINKKLHELDRVVIGPKKEKKVTIGLDLDKDSVTLMGANLQKAQTSLIEKHIDRLIDAIDRLMDEIEHVGEEEVKKTMKSHKSDAPILEYERSPFSGHNEWESMIGKLYAIGSSALLDLWKKLDGYDPDEPYDFGISMEDYAVALHMELSKRRIPHKKLTKKGKK